MSSPAIRLPARLAGAFFAIAAALPASAATLPNGFTETRIATGLSSPTAMAFAPDGRLFVCQQGGQLRIVKNGALLATPFLTVTVNSSGERGLLGVAFDPAFATNRFVYVYYTATTPAIHNRVSRFTASGDVAVAGSEQVILELDNLSSATNHNGGAMHFGPDGKLYIAVGENANGANSQTLTNLLGKVLRINKDGTIPSDNPFFGTATGTNRAIWAMGLRNPFTFAFQPGTGRMFINDVGQSAFEEIDDGIAGSNYGWPESEGPTTNPAHRGPVFWYGHGSSGTTGCAITGGAFYNPSIANFPPSFTGHYFFADYCSGWIREVNPASGFAVSGFATGISSPVDLQLGSDGTLWYLERGTGSVWRVEYTASQAPQVTAQPASITVATGQPASFSVSASGTAPLQFQWQRDGVDIAGATSTTYSLASAQLSDNGATFR
ncbi:MAG TPA: PQQ-dependent sugar dehydrogenase, partial [Vicinamibacteria bacterium]|nr:PQQ-dependent sugar dehydrogenase [Vicinamibacteria bacterium]